MRLAGLFNRRVGPLLVAGLAGLLAGAAAGLGAGYTLDVQQSTPRPSAQARALDTARLDQALAMIKTAYYEPNLDYRKLAEGSVRGMVASLGDPYSYYLSPDQYQRLERQDNGLYSGVGIYLDAGACSSHPVVSGIVPGSPAEQRGIKTGDVLLSIDGTSTSSLPAEQAAADIQGPSGTSVQLGLQRGDRTFQVKLMRASITVPTVLSADLGGGTLYLRIYEFDTSTARDFHARLKQGLPTARGIVLDLRDNPGGLIEGAASVISEFVSSGVALELRGRSGPPAQIQVSGSHPAASIPLVVLVNSNTASAAEIVAGSLAAHGRARLVGTATFGKDSVQGDFPLADGADLHLTVQRWFLPGGRSVQGTGLRPDVEVPLGGTEDRFNVEHPGGGHALDAQLNRALALLERR
jgi:carboxyl-terminal processing protease